MEEPLPIETEVVDDRCPQCGHEVGGAWLVCAWCGQQLAAPAELPVGTRLADGRYQILRVIGRGGFGITYEVGDRRLERRVAMKELFPDSAVRHGSVVLTPPQARAGFSAARQRFLREARVLARFTHPGIVRVYEVFEEHGTAYLVMELLEGRNLVELLQQRGRPFPEADVLDVAGRVAAALRPVHAAGVLHRDVNPSNVMLTHHGRIVVIDFGLARDYDQHATAGMTRMVTPGYAPLEQYRGEGRFGPATDVYGLAATCYRLATGRVPVSALDRDAGAALPSPGSLNPGISKGVSDAILDGLELEPGHRPQDLDSFLARLGITQLPSTPRSSLLDTVPPPSAELDGSATGLAPSLVGVPVSTPFPPRVPAHPSPVPVHPSPAAASPAAPVASVVGPGPAVGPGPGRAADAEPVTSATVLVPRHGAAARSVAPAPPLDPDLTWGPEGVGATVHDPDATRAGGAVPTSAAPASAATAYPSPVPPAFAVPPAGPAGAVAHQVAPPPDPRLPLAVGPHRPGRRKVTLPVTVALLAAASAAPVLLTALVVLVAIPVLATLGDSVAHRLRAEHGVATGWAERRMSPGALAPTRFLRNVVVAVLRASPVIGVGAVLLAGWYGLDRLTDARALLDLTLRAIGLFVVGVILATSHEGSSRFRTGLGLDELVARLAPEGRTTERLVIGWVLSVVVVAGALWLTPDPFPLP